MATMKSTKTMLLGILIMLLGLCLAASIGRITLFDVTISFDSYFPALLVTGYIIILVGFIVGLVGFVQRA
jgi:hypothetical protein